LTPALFPGARPGAGPGARACGPQHFKAEAMKERTLHKIMGDPEFNPGIFIEEAIIEFVKQHPLKVAEDKVALRHLIADSDIAPSLHAVIDINDPDMIESWLATMKQGQSWNKNEVCAKFIGRLSQVEAANSEAIFKVLNRYTSDFECLTRPSTMMSLANIFGPANLASMIVELAVIKKATRGWVKEDWDAVFAQAIDHMVFIEALEEDRVIMRYSNGTSQNENNFRTISEVAKAVKGTAAQERLIKICKKSWHEYVCFKCGRDQIKSISGYTLHRKKCDSQNVYPCPWETFYGIPRELSFRCDCGADFTTSSGLTLHKKACR